MKIRIDVAMTTIVNIACALGTASAGLALLFGSWRGRIGSRWLPVPVGWLLLLLSAWFWVAGAGVEFGVSLALLVPSGVAWLFVAGNWQRRTRRKRRDAGPPKPVADRRSLSRHALLFLLVVPLAAVASTLLAVALSLALPTAEINAMVTVLAVMPVLWGCAAYWALADTHIARPAVAMVLVAAMSAAAIYI